MFRIDQIGLRRSSAEHGGARLRPLLPPSNRGARAVSPARCSVCGDKNLSFDEVLADTPLLLGECRHCDHRWTTPLPMASSGASCEGSTTSPSRAA